MPLGERTRDRQRELRARAETAVRRQDLQQTQVQFFKAAAALAKRVQVGPGALDLRIAFGRVGRDAIGERSAQFDLGLEALDDGTDAAEAASQGRGRIQKPQVQAPRRPQRDGFLDIEVHPGRNGENGEGHGLERAAL
jgi:hypothetical protein